MPKLLPLLFLYFSEGLPFGFQAIALPLLLRERGVSLEAIGFAGLLSSPWLAKPLWAPLVDRYGSEWFGRRKSWIVPMQAGLALCAFTAAQVERPELMFALIFAMNLCAATMDIAVDGLAVSWLEPGELGPGNALQVVGYKLGMLTGGGLLVWLSGQLSATWGWSGLFNAMGAMFVAVLLVSLWMREPPTHSSAAPQPAAASAPSAPSAPRGFGHIFARLRAALRHRSTAALIAVVMTYKLGESMADAMWKPMLFDRGFPTPRIALWTGTFGMVCSLIGSTTSGMVARAVALPVALGWIAVLRASAVGGQFWISLTPQPTAAQVIAVTCFEHLFAGAITTVMFALMMRHTDREIGATHYTLLASLEVWGKLPFGAVSGFLAAWVGYGFVFGLATALCIAFAGLVALLRPRL